jgi:hypothetical protein
VIYCYAPKSRLHFPVLVCFLKDSSAIVNQNNLQFSSPPHLGNSKLLLCSGTISIRESKVQLGFELWRVCMASTNTQHKPWPPLVCQNTARNVLDVCLLLTTRCIVIATAASAAIASPSCLRGALFQIIRTSLVLCHYRYCKINTRRHGTSCQESSGESRIIWRTIKL